MSTISSTDRPVKRIFLFAYLLVLLLDLVAIGMAKEQWRFITKPMLMPLLLAYFLTNTNAKLLFNQWMVLALVFSGIGDIMLMFESDDPIFFLLGLGSFLLAHVFYIIYFNRVRAAENVSWKLKLLIPVFIYYGVLIVFLFPYLGDMKIAVVIYGFIITTMLFLALHMFYIANKTAGRLFIAGALLFVLSDSILAVNKFYAPFEFAGLAIMITYGMAQLLLVDSAIRLENQSARFAKSAGNQNVSYI